MSIRCPTSSRIRKYSIQILYFTFNEFIILLYTSLVIYFALYKEYMICFISLSKFSDALPAITCVRAIGILWSISLGDNILKPSPYFVLYLAADKIEE